MHAELAEVRPRLLVTLGVTAAKALLGTSFRLTQHRSEVLEYAELPLVATIHPSAVLRAPKDRQAEMLDERVADLQLAGRGRSTAFWRQIAVIRGLRHPIGRRYSTGK